MPSPEIDACLASLRRTPDDARALHELASLAAATGHRKAACTAWARALRQQPDHLPARIGLANLLLEDGALPEARMQYEAALAATPELPAAHQGLARILDELGEDASVHWHRGFAGHAVAQRRYRGPGAGIPLLLLVSARGGNIPVRHWIDERVFAVTAIYAEYADPAAALPPHDLIVNAIGDADLCAMALDGAAALVARSDARVINAPDQVRHTGRAANAARLGLLPGVIAPRVASFARAGFTALADWEFPLLLRAPGHHTGRHFLRVAQPASLAAAVAELPGDRLLAISALDARGADGMARKYRVMLIGGVPYPLHLAISADWKVHYFTAGMAGNPAHRAEEAHFLRDMAGVLGPRAMAALAAIGQKMALDYAGVDFALAPDGSLLLFEANAAMVVNPPDPDPIWDYRRPAIAAALAAMQHLLTMIAPRA